MDPLATTGNAAVASPPLSTGTTPAAGTGPGTGTTPPAAPPASAQEAMERASASASSADTPSPAGQPGSAAASPASAAVTSEFHVPKTKEEYDRILANARDKAIAEYRGKVGWAENVNQEAVTEAIALAQEIQADPRAFAQALLAELGGQQEEELIDPEPDYHAPDGSAQFYSDKTVKTLLSNLEKRMTRQFKPAMTMVEQAQEQERMRGISTEAAATAKEVMTAIRQYPHFEKYKLDIADKLEKIDVTLRRRIGSPAALLMAYHAVIQEKDPEIRATLEQEIRQGFNKSAAASVGSVQPGSQASTRKPVRDGDVEGLAKRMEELSAEMAGQP